MTLLLLRFASKSSWPAVRFPHSLRVPRLPRMISTPPAASTSQIVTIPHLPELYDPNFLDALLPPTPREVAAADDWEVLADDAQAAAKNELIEALKATQRHTFTENASPAYSSTESSTLNAFYAIKPYAGHSDIHETLSMAWAEDPTLTLKIIWNVRSIHDGKGDKEAFYRAWGWLYQHHPRTAIANLHQLVTPVCKRRGKNGYSMPHGYWKDLLNLLALVTLNQLHAGAPTTAPYLHTPGSRWDPADPRRYQGKSKRDPVVVHQLLVETRLKEPHFKALYIAVARLFAEQLAADCGLLREAELLPEDSAERKSIIRRLTLLGKWAPSPGNSHDRVTNISTAVCLLLRKYGILDPLALPINLSAPLPSFESHVLRSYYQRWVLKPLRAATCLPEPLMSAKRWNEVVYRRVPSVCMQNNSVHFFRHDPERFGKYLEDVESGKQSISGATLMPHELVFRAAKMAAKMHLADYEPTTAAELLAAKVLEVKATTARREQEVVEAQFATLISRLREAGKLDNALAICDVSGSMGYFGAGEPDQPIFPAIALSYILSQLARPPFNNAFITFSAIPEFVTLDPARGLVDNVHRMSTTHWTMNTDLHAVFVNLILPLAVQNNVPQSDMIKRLFIFSDMQFDEATSSSSHGSSAAKWETNHDEIVRAYAEAGYEVPEIVYWNLSKYSATTPVLAERAGVAMISGFSPAMLKVFMGDEEVEAEAESEDGTTTTRSQFNPVSVMKRALGVESFDGLVVLD
ncbi:hypothetical protein FA95DRAFT_1566528 [Auriscalpium vulgare]|uniref:Uncharacterized protein n=1 Tax=Auriscalpium vulgare TaxID=40419 RepID=A0ACB8R881_9AGAM|nr:hypothetical protein FA95DRAFT_1566528 [Auriscalpium vulgare]